MQPSVPELTLLCDEHMATLSSSAHHRCNSNVTCDRSTSQLMPTSGCSTETVNSLLTSPPSVAQALGTTGQLVPQMPSLDELYHPVATNGGQHNSHPCCHHCCTSPRHNMSPATQDAPCVDKSIGNQAGSYSAAGHFAHSSASVYPPASALITGSMQNILPPGAGCVKIQDTTPPPAVVNSAVGVPCRSGCLQVEIPPSAEPNMYPSAVHSGSQHIVQKIHSPSLAAFPPPYSGQPVTSGLRENGEFHQYPFPFGTRGIQSGHQHRLQSEARVENLGCDQTGCCLQSGQRTSRLPVERIRYSPPSSQQTPYALVHQQQQQWQYIPHPHSPLIVECASPVQAGAHHCLSRVSPSAAVKEMRCNDLHQPFTAVPAISQHSELPGGIKSAHSVSLPVAPLLVDHCNVPACQPGVVCEDDDRYLSVVNQSQQSRHQVELQLVSCHSSTPVANVPSFNGPRTVNDLLSNLPVQHVDWSVVLPKDSATVDGFVESVLGHISASADSGVLVTNATMSPDTLPHNPPTDSGILYDVGDCAANGEEGHSSHPLSMNEHGKVDIKPPVSGRPEFFEDQPDIAKLRSFHIERPTLCSVAVNTSFCWRPADDESPWSNSNTPSSDTVSVQNQQNVAQTVSDLIMRSNDGYVGDKSASAASVEQRLLITDRDTELGMEGSVSLDVRDSMGIVSQRADGSMCTPPPPIFPNPSDQSVVSEMILDMPEYTALSQEK